MPQKNLYSLEQEYWSKDLLICGIDEVGRGCLAGPVVTAAAILHPKSKHPLLKDSKKLTALNLVQMYQWLLNHCTFSISINSWHMIDDLNIYKTTQITMKQSLLHVLTKTKQLPALILVDAMPLTLHATPFSNIPILSFTKGESKSASIAAASILAKVTRDMIITRLHESFPGFGFSQHKGYATPTHQAALQTLHPSIIHRLTFIKKFLTKDTHEQQSIFC